MARLPKPLRLGIMQPEIIEAIFDTKVHIETLHGQPVAIYYRQGVYSRHNL